MKPVNYWKEMLRVYLLLRNIAVVLIFAEYLYRRLFWHESLGHTCCPNVFFPSCGRLRSVSLRKRRAPCIRLAVCQRRESERAPKRGSQADTVELSWSRASSLPFSLVTNSRTLEANSTPWGAHYYCVQMWVLPVFWYIHPHHVLLVNAAYAVNAITRVLTSELLRITVACSVL